MSATQYCASARVWAAGVLEVGVEVGVAVGVDARVWLGVEVGVGVVGWLQLLNNIRRAIVEVPTNVAVADFLMYLVCTYWAFLALG